MCLGQIGFGCSQLGRNFRVRLGKTCLGILGTLGLGGSRLGLGFAASRKAAACANDSIMRLRVAACSLCSGASQTISAL